jgi:Lrp/AsnC family leucine-responsive transcriptional regulator
MTDCTDLEILKLLKENSRLQWKEVGEKVHLTGQAVAARIKKLKDLGIIEGFTVALNSEKLGNRVTCFISVHMKSNDHFVFQQFIRGREEITEAHRTSGGGCYMLKVSLPDQNRLNELPD